MDLTKICKRGIKRLITSLKRFPYALTLSTLTTITLFILVNWESFFELETIDTLRRIAMTMALGFPLYLNIKTLIERKTIMKKTSKIIIRIIAAAILISYYFLLLKDINMVTISRYIAINLSLYLLFLVIPYYYKKKNFELYVIKIFSRLSITIIYSLVLFAGLSMTLFTLNKLLNVPVTEELYVSIGLLVIGIFAPIFLLAEIPRQNEKINIKEYPRVFEILLLYIVMPLISFYTSILYIYFVKILIIQQWPEGLVGHLVLWYSLLSVIILFFISPLKKNNKWVKFFSLWLPRALIPLLLMMFTAIGIRINTYGVTENRYYVVLLGIWVLGIMFYYIFSRKKNRINNLIIPLSLAIITFLAVFGPWSSYSISIYSQNKRFENIIRKYDMVEDSTIVKSEKQITRDDQKEIETILRYFESNHQFADLKYLPDNFKAKDTEELFGFTYQERYNPAKLQRFSYNFNKNKQAFSVKNYHYLFHISNFNNEIILSNPESNLTVKLNNQNKEITINRKNKEIYRQSLIPILIELHKKNKEIPAEKLNQKDFIYFDQTNNLKLKYIFNSFYGSTEKTNPDNINIRNVDFYLLIRETT